MPKGLFLSSSLIVLLLLALAAACDGDDDGAPGGQTPTAEGGPRVQIGPPAHGDTLPAGDVQITANVAGFEVVDKINEPPVEGEGHIHFYLDVDQIPTAPGQPAVTAEGTYHAAATTTYTWPDVQPGEHTFAVQLVNNNHTPLEPPITAQITVTVE